MAPKGKGAKRVVKAKKVKKGGDVPGGEKPLRRGKSVEQTYQKKTQVEHILLRPDTYVGSVEKQEDQLWCWENDEMSYRTISYVPALYKIFDEILVNAADNLQRDKSMNTIKVEIDTKQKRIKVWNNGKGLPIQIHKKHKVYVPELVFGHLLTSDNYDDSEKKVTGGRNGFGAKLTNIFSDRFLLETTAGGKKYSQQWTSNMSRKGKPEIKKYSGEQYTSVEFWPDLGKFGMKDLEADTVAYMRKRVYDIAGTSGERCGVYLDGKKLPVKGFVDYCSLFHSAEKGGYVHARVNKRWEILVAKSDGDGFHHNSFCNAISTPKAGTHVQHVVDQLVDAIMVKAKREAGKGFEIKPVHVKNNLWVFINCLIENPAFSSQTKEQMTLKASNFGSTCPISRALIDEILEKTDLVSAVVAEATAKMTAQMDKNSKGGKGKRVLGIPKLEDANEAGGKSAHECSLILTEGDSAKALAIAGLGVIGRDKFGVFPLRGKLLNVRDAPQRMIAENKEIMAIVKILGLSFGTKGDKQKMRYGSVMIMADQDQDGSHIKGLLINFFHYWWPDLLKEGGFVKEFVTPIVKASKGGEKQVFFTQTEYEAWKHKLGGSTPGWQIKYYKGLGTSTAAEAKEYFSAMDDHKLDFKWKSNKDGELIDMAFNKSRADDRKVWMNSYVEGTCVDHSQPTITYDDFIKLELVQFSKYSVMRSVPSIMDGMKPTQRKVLYCCFKRNLRSDVKVAQLVGYIGEHSAYHHGEMSLSGTIISMAQDFVGSNNINLLVPSGQFGTRSSGGQDHASARYIYTRMAPLTRLIFSPLDDAILKYLNEDGQKIEPTWYAPIIPMVLVNGATGIGTGWSTDIPNYDPLAIIDNLREFIKKKKMKPMRPWYRGFTGKMEHCGKGSYHSWGVCTEKKTGSGFEITELPIRKWTQDYKEFLQTMLPGAEKSAKFSALDIREYHNECKVHFDVKMSPEEVTKVEKEGVKNAFKLSSNVNETNMVLFDNEGRIRRYKNTMEIIEEFAGIRLKYYVLRKNYLIEKLTLERDLLSNRARFIALIIAKKLHINNRKKADVVKDLTKLKFKKFGDEKPPRTGFEYLLIMQIASLTKERKEELERMAKEKAKELEIVKKTSERQMWTHDLDQLEAGIQRVYAEKEADDAKAGKGKKGKKTGKGKKRASKDEDAEDGAGEDGAEEDTAGVAAEDNPFSDVTRWTAGCLKGPHDESGSKRRRTT